MSIIKGLANLGNTCYMNSVLQALFSLDDFNKKILMCIKNKLKEDDEMNSLLREYLGLLLTYYKINNDASFIRPITFKKILEEKNEMFRGGGQNDSHELLAFLLSEYTDEKNNKFLRETIRDIICGKYKQYIKCSICDNVSITNNDFFDIQLPISNKMNPSLNDCLDNFLKEEKLDEDNKFLCSKCNKKVVINRRVELTEVPEILILTLNRFDGQSRKISIPVMVPKETKIHNTKFKLITTINHYGGTRRGHYTSYISRNNKWYEADDRNIRSVNPDRFTSDPAIYIAFYQKQQSHT